MHCFDGVPLRGGHERAVVVRRVFGSQAGWAVVASSGLQRGRIKRIDLLTSISGEGDVQPTNDVGRRDREVVCLLQTERNVGSALAPRPDLREPQRSQRSAIE